MKCEICQKGPTDPQPTTVFRQNEFGKPGRWRCREHNQKPIATEVDELVQILDPQPTPHP